MEWASGHTAARLIVSSIVTLGIITAGDDAASPCLVASERGATHTALPTLIQGAEHERACLRCRSSRRWGAGQRARETSASENQSAGKRRCPRGVPARHPAVFAHLAMMSACRQRPLQRRRASCSGGECTRSAMRETHGTATEHVTPWRCELRVKCTDHHINHHMW